MVHHVYLPPLCVGAADGVWHSMQARAWACLNCSSCVVDFAERLAACTGECLWM